MPAAKEVVEGASKLKTILPMIGGGILTPIALDYRMNTDPNATFGVSTIKDIFSGKLDKDRAFNLGLNSLIGAAGGGLLLHKPVEGAGMLALAPAKDLIMNSLSAPKEITKSMQTNNMILGALGLGALGLGGAALAHKLMKKAPKEGAKIKLKLPGKKGDPSTAAEVELPINMPEFSPALTEGLDKAVRLRTRKNIRANSLKRDPQTGKLIPYDEWKDKYGGSPNPDSVGQSAPTDHAYAIPQGFQNTLDKAASTLETHERFGDLISSILPTIGGAVLGSDLAERNGISARLGGIAGGVLGGVAPTLLGRALATITGKRTVEEQAAHDMGTPSLEYLIPGYAVYQAEKRDQAEEDEKRHLVAQQSSMATGQPLPPSYAGGAPVPSAVTSDEMDDMEDGEGGDFEEDEELDDVEKMAAAMIKRADGFWQTVWDYSLPGMMWNGGKAIANAVTGGGNSNNPQQIGQQMKDLEGKYKEGYEDLQKQREDLENKAQQASQQAQQQNQQGGGGMFKSSGYGFEKFAGQAPPPGGGGGGGGGGPTPGGLTRQVDPTKNQVASGIKKPGDVSKIHDLVTNMDHRLQVAKEKPAPIAVQKPQSLADIQGTMQGVSERLHNMRMNHG